MLDLHLDKRSPVALHIQNLTKTYGRITAVDALSLEVLRGQVYGLLGPNGSGKTTTLGMVLGITRPDGGQFTWFDGHYGADYRRHLGALLETPNFYPYLSARKNLELVARIKRVAAPNVPRLLDLVNLGTRADYPFKTFSLGMKQRLAIAATLVGDPELLIFDEPANGLDPQGIAEVRNTIIDIAATGKTIIMASHILDEVEKVCSHVAIIKRGKLLTTGTVGAIMSSDVNIEIGSPDLARLRDVLRAEPRINQVETIDNRLLLTVDQSLTPGELNALAFRNNITVDHLRVKKLSLEAEFLAITGDNRE